MISGTKSEDIIEVINKIPQSIRNKVKEVTVDMAANMHLVIKRCFRKADSVVDRFHVQKLALDGLDQLRVSRRWEAIDDENRGMAQARINGIQYVPSTFENGDTLKQLLLRSRHLLFKSREKWSDSQKKRARILFGLYPEIEKAYNITNNLRCIFNQRYTKDVAKAKLALWYNKTEEFIDEYKEIRFKYKKDPTKTISNPFNSILNSIQSYSDKILNFFNNRSTNASAECFNSKLKAFRADMRGVSDIPFFLYRLANIYAR